MDEVKLKQICKKINCDYERLSDFEKEQIVKIAKMFEVQKEKMVNTINDAHLKKFSAQEVCDNIGIGRRSLYNHRVLLDYIDTENDYYMQTVNHCISKQSYLYEDLKNENKYLKDRDIEYEIMLNENKELEHELKAAKNEISRLYKLIAELRSNQGASFKKAN